MRLFLLVLFCVGGVAFSVFALTCSHVLPVSIIVLFSSNIIGSTAVNAATPLFFELSCEAAYPVAEGVTNSVVTLLNNVAGFAFLGILMLTKQSNKFSEPFLILKGFFCKLCMFSDTSWTNWAVTGCTVVCIPIFIFYKEQYTRLDIDDRDRHSHDHESPRTEIVVNSEQR